MYNVLAKISNLLACRKYKKTANNNWANYCQKNYKKIKPTSWFARLFPLISQLDYVSGL